MGVEVAGRRTHEPSRQCVGCGHRGPQSGFLRLTLNVESTPAEVVPADRREHEGRGAYLCRSRACLDRAVQRKAFERAFRRSVTIDANCIAVVIRETRQESK